MSSDRSSSSHVADVFDRIRNSSLHVLAAEEAHATKFVQRRERSRLEALAEGRLDRAQRIARNFATPGPLPKGERQRAIRGDLNVVGELSALDVLPYMDKFRAATFDAMHVLLLG